MSRRCRSIRRAMKRGHYVNIYNGTYESSKEAKIHREKFEAAARKAVDETQKDNDNE